MSDSVPKVMDVIETKRLRLRPICMDDEEVVFKIFSNDRLMEPYGMFALDHRDKAIQFTQRLIDDYEFAVVEKNEGKVIGTLGFVDYSKYNKRTEIAFELLEDYWHKGYMSEAVGGFIGRAFDRLQLNRIEAFVHPNNIASQKLLEKLGFANEGLLRKRSLQRGAFRDTMIYGLVRV